MTFEELVDHAQAGDSEAMLTLFEKYRPLTAAHSFGDDGCFDPDLWQDQCHRFLIVLQKFNKERALGEAAGKHPTAPGKPERPIHSAEKTDAGRPSDPVLPSLPSNDAALS